MSETAPSNEAPLIEAVALEVRFGKVTALDGLDLSAPTGEVLAILGPNGAGKTTFVRTIATLVAPSGGTLSVRGLDVTEHPTGVRREIGLAGQAAAVEPTMTGRENLEMVARLFGHRRRRARAVADEVIELLDLGEVAGRRSGGYSGGQRRRLDLGASLVGAPRLLLLDEPTTGLDPAGRAEVWAAVRNLVGGGTDVLLTTHYLEEADELAERVVVIDRGRAIAAGTASELKAGIGRDVIEVVLATTDQLGAAASLLERLTADAPVIDPGNRRLRSRADGGVLDLAEAIRAFQGGGVAVEEIALRRPTLDEAFLALTASPSTARSGVDRPLPDSVSTGDHS
ncbi:MAG: ATP-binding cassette domain-containing protein [Acidimicrobiaceae bacterium]|nr:ATP-binding cassette domain-containing protein [Acidimicrobiaceae bacterium]